MQKPLKIWGLYLGFILLISLLFSLSGISKSLVALASGKIIFTPVIIISIIGGFIAMRLTVQADAFRVFTIIYISLWLLRFLLLFAGNHIGQVNFAGKAYHVDFIISHYYENTSRLDTPLPFLLFWFVNYFFINDRPE